MVGVAEERYGSFDFQEGERVVAAWVWRRYADDVYIRMIIRCELGCATRGWGCKREGLQERK
jgi:hypothetical protein